MGVLGKVLGRSVAAAGAGVLLSLRLGFIEPDNPLVTKVAMPLIRKIDPENAHRLGVLALKMGLGPVERRPEDPILRTTFLGLKFDNPLGLAAGFDKHGEAAGGALKLGFGAVEVGSVTPQPQPGNPKPRVFRLLEDNAVINRYGFNSVGHVEALQNLIDVREQRTRGRCHGVIGVNLGKNKSSADAAADYTAGVDALGPVADYLVINVSSPNTPGLRSLQREEELAKIVSPVLKRRDELSARSKENKLPVLVKIAPDLSPEELQALVSVALKTKVDGLIISNTTLDRAGLQNEHKGEAGGLSGKPVFEKSTNMLAEVYRLTNGQLPLVGVGGVSSGADAYAKIRAGASIVQLYTSMSIEGPQVVPRVKRELADLLRRDGFRSVKEAVGADHRSGKK